MMAAEITVNDATPSECRMVEEQLHMKKILTHRTSKSVRRSQVLSPKGNRGLKMRDKHISLKEKTVSQSSNVSEQPSTSNVHSAKPVPSKYPVKYPNGRPNCMLSEKEEIIKYMSSLPCYLQHPERRDETQNKALSFGVLDWSLLEDWKHNHSHVVSGASGSKTTSAFPASNPSTSSCIVNKSCSNRQRRASLSSSDFCRRSLTSRADCDNTSAQTSKAFSDSKIHARWVKSTSAQRRGVDQMAGYMDLDLHNMKKKSPNKEAFSLDPFASARKGARASCIKDYDFLSSTEEFEKQNVSSSEKYCFGDSFLTSEQPRGGSLAGCPDVQSSRLQPMPAGTASGLDGNNLCKGSHSQKDSFSDPDHKIQQPLMLPQREVKSSPVGESSFDINLDEEIPLHSRIENQLQTANNTVGTGGNSVSGKGSGSIDCTDLSCSTSCQSKITKTETKQELSPIRSSSLCRTPRSQSFREGIGTRTSTFIIPRSDSVKSDTPTHQDDSPIQVKTHSRNQFSPLRRMFSPLVKSKGRTYLPSSSAASLARNKHEVASLGQSLLQELSLGAEEGCKLSRKKLLSGDGTTEKASGFSAPQSASPDDSMLEKKRVSLSKHALLQIISKNGIPLFIFSSNNRADAFAAVERKISINKKNTLYWKYTFHSITSVKKKSGWLKQGKKTDRCWQISNVVGHMEASCFFPHLAREGIPESPLMIEYVLSGVRSRELSDEKPDLKCQMEDLLNGITSFNELAAVIIKTHCEPVKSSVRQDDDRSNTGAAFTETNSCANYSNHSIPDMFKKEKQSCSNVKVILPSGVHGIPANDAGMPSRLIDRWRSGGSCDCGGWDEGCSLTILDSQGSKGKTSLSTSPVSCDSDACEHVDLFLQGAQPDALAFRFAATREGLYSIDFDARMSSLHAFSIGIAILHSRKNTITARMGTKTLLESLLATRDDRFQMPTRSQGTGPLKSIPDPPLSPVGRA